MDDRLREIFISRRNRVWREGGKVYKQMLPENHAGDFFEPAVRASLEADALKKLRASGVRVPRFISVSGDVIAMEYVEGLTLTQYIESKETDLPCAPWAAADVAEAITDWFEAFYAAVPQGVIRGDVNCCNFLISPDGAVAGVDFERECFGERETDLGRILAFILTYDPMYTPFKAEFADVLCAQFAGRFSLDLALVALEKERELEAIKIRRSKTDF